jgi:pimeloyl-ACP methyl ester carboxylesterase
MDISTIGRSRNASANGRIQHITGALAVAALMSAAVPAHAGTSGGTQLPTTVPVPPPLNWQPCEANSARECATLKVPLNYANLSEGYIDLPVARRRATTQSLGPLVMNFGGPVSAAAFAIEDSDERLQAFIPPEVMERYDVVGLNARAMTDGINCFDEQTAQEYWQTNHFTRTSAELDHLLQLEQAANQRCLANNQPLIRHMSSAESIRDLESLRLALGVNQFSFFGLSYGTFFGNRYAALYPGRLKAMVLDAVVDHSISDPEILYDLNTAHEAAWTAFKQWCADTANTCRLRGQDLDALFNQALAKARSPGIPAPYDPIDPARPVNDWELDFALEYTVTFGVLYPWTEEILYRTTLNDASLAGYIYDVKVGASGTFRAITCVDSRWSQLLPNASAAHAFTLSAKAVSPHFGESDFVQAPQQCYQFPVPPTEPPPLNMTVAAGIPPVLVIGGVLDRSAPFKWAQHVASLIPGSRLIVRNGTGHVSVDKSRCVRKIVSDYLVLNIAPASGTQCSSDPDLWSEALAPVPDLIP